MPIDKKESHAKLSAKCGYQEKGSKMEVKGGDNEGTLNGCSKGNVGGQVAKSSGIPKLQEGG
jgi:hypothetical protein